jgi:hypothetical protein
MSGWKKAMLMNGGWLMGIVISLFVVPPKTPLWMWGTVSGLALVLLNYLFFGRQRKAAGGRKVGLVTTVVGGLGILILFLDVILRHLHL